MTKVIVVTSGKGGVGKTTTAVNLGAAANYFGKKVIILDGNLSTPNVGIHLGSPEVPIHLNHVLRKEADLGESIYEHNSGIQIIPASLSVDELEKTDSKRLKKLKKELKDKSDIVIVDCSAGLGEEATSALEMADEVILVTNPELPAITDALKTVKVIEKMKKPITGTIVTRVRKNTSEMQPDIVKEMLETPILGMIPEDSNVQASLNLRDAVVNTHPKSNASRAYKEIISELMNLDYDSNKDKESVWEKIKRKFGKK